MITVGECFLFILQVFYVTLLTRPAADSVEPSTWKNSNPIYFDSVHPIDVITKDQVILPGSCL